VRQYPESVDIVGETGNYYFYRYTDQTTGQTSVESVKRKTWLQNLMMSKRGSSKKENGKTRKLYIKNN